MFSDIEKEARKASDPWKMGKKQDESYIIPAFGFEAPSR